MMTVPAIKRTDRVTFVDETGFNHNAIAYNVGAEGLIDLVYVDGQVGVAFAGSVPHYSKVLEDVEETEQEADARVALEAMPRPFVKAEPGTKLVADLVAAQTRETLKPIDQPQSDASAPQARKRRVAGAAFWRL